MAGYLCLMPLASSLPMASGIFFANYPCLMPLASLHSVAPFLFLRVLPWAGRSMPFQGVYDGNLSNNIRILTPKNGGCWSRKGHSVEKTSIFEVFCNVLNDRWLREWWFIIWRSGKNKFAKGKVSLHERPCFRRWNITFEAVKAYLSRCET